MAFHRFRIGQRVVASAFSVPPGPYEIMGLQPIADGVPFYRVKSVADGHERAIAEPSLLPAPMPANSDDTTPRQPLSKAR